MSNRCGPKSYEKDWNGLNITTLYVKPLAGKLKSDEIFTYFSAFGDVQKVRIRNKKTRSYGFVKFTVVESAVKALRIDLHIISGKRVEIAVAKDKHQHKTTLLDLNDDCIHEILSTKCLSIIDLCSVAEASPRLKEIASRVFRREHMFRYLQSLSEESSKTAKRILMNFGSVMTFLKVTGRRGSDGWRRDVLNSVARYCRNTLEAIYFDNLYIPANFTTKFRPAFNNLKKLSIDSCHLNGARTELFADCGSLVELDIARCRVVSACILENTFPKLQKFKIDGEFDMELMVKSFISRHTNLKSIKCYNRSSGSSVLSSIADCRQLEELRCRIPNNHTLDFSNLDHLRKLNVDCDERSISETALGMKNLIVLEDLELQCARIDAEFVRTLSQLKRLQVLRFGWNCTGLENLNQIGDLNQLTTLEILSFDYVELDIVLLVKRLMKLNYLQVSFNFKINLEIYRRLVEAVLRRGDNSKLTIKLYHNDHHNYDDLSLDLSRNAHIVEMIFKRTVITLC